MTRTRIAAVLLAASLALPAAGAAQDGALHGRVVESGTRAPLAGARVEVDGPARRAAQTGPDGRWRIDALPAGDYAVRVAHPGFAAWSGAAAAGADALEVRLAPSPLALDALVVTASRRAQRLADAPVTTEIVTRREIEASGVPDLSTLLTERMGIQVAGGHPSGEGIMLQGLGSERVLVLVDGQPLVGRISGTLDLSRIPTAMIERVEVVKGAQSSLFGSEAMGGVVNVITRAPAGRPVSASAQLTGGTQGRADAAGSLDGTLGAFRYRADLGRRSTDHAPGRGSDADALATRTDGAVKLGWAAAPGLSLHASALLLDERQRWRDGALHHFADNTQLAARAGAEWTRGVNRVAPSIYLTRFEHLPRRATGATPVDGSGEAEVQRLLEVEVLVTRALGVHTLDGGVEAGREEIDSERVAGRERAMHRVEPFAQATFDLGRLQLVPGARLNWSEAWGTRFTPRVAAMYRPVAALALRASVGSGFRAPSFKELAMEFLNVGPGFGYVVRGNPELRPETSVGTSLGAEWAVAGGYVRGQAFHNRFRGFIETRLVGDSSGVEVYTYGNVDDGHTRGLELEGGVVRGPLRLEAGYAYLEAHDRTLDAALLGRPAHSGRATLEHALPLGVRGALTGVYTGRTPISRTDAGTAVHRDPFVRMDLRLARRLPRGLDLAAGARNVLDARPDGWPGFAGRHLYLSLGWSAAGARPAHPQLD